VETIYHPSIPNNEDYWNILENDEYIKEFISHATEMSLDQPSLDDSPKIISKKKVEVL